MGNPNDPTFQTTGDPYLTVPDGTTAPDIGGDPVDLTGIPITVAPESDGVQAGQHASILAFGDGGITVGGLVGMTSASVGRSLTLLDPANAGNRGTFTIAAVLNDHIVFCVNANGVFPDTNSGSIAWKESADPTDFAPGDPLTFLANTDGPFSFNIDQATGAPHGGGQELLPPNVDVGAVHVGDLIYPSSVPVSESTGKNDPVQDPTDPATPPTTLITPILTAGDVVFTDPQNPVREVPSASLLVNHDVDSPAFGLQPILADGPAVEAPSRSVSTPEAGVTPEVVPAGNMVYATANPVVFSKGP